METLTPIRAIRETCLDCSGGIRKYVAYCPCDGVHSTRCHQWPYRFGCRPESAAERFGAALVTPGLMPAADTPLETLPNNPADYGRRMVEAGKAAPVEKRVRMSEQKRRDLAEQLQRVRQARRNGSNEAA